MAWPKTVLAPLALLLGAVPPAHGGFVDDLRESVELSKQQEAEKPSPKSQPKNGAPAGAAKSGTPEPAAASGGGGGTGAERTPGRGDGERK